MTTARKLKLMLKLAIGLAGLNLAMAAVNLLLWQDYCARKDTAFGTRLRVDKLERDFMSHQHVQQPPPKPNS